MNPSHHRFVLAVRSLPALPVLAVLALAACGSSPEEDVASQHEIGQCTRDELALRGPAITCALDVDCPCGAFCDVDHTCRFSCMVPPGSPAESCPTGTQCDDTGRCVGPNQAPPSVGPVVTANPPALATVAGGAAQSLQVRLAVFTSAAATAAQTTQLRAIGVDGAEVSCDATTFGAECALTGWSFAFDGTRYNASRTLSARTRSSTPLGHGEVRLRIDSTDTDVMVPVSATPASSSHDGLYRGTATNFYVPKGIPITVTLDDRFLILRDPTRTLAPDGVLIASVPTATNPSPTPWRLPWLFPQNPTNGGGLMADYLPFLPSFPQPGVMTGLLQRRLLGSLDNWSVRVSLADRVAFCNVDGDCASGEVCPLGLRVCVPPSAWNSGPTVDNQFDDPRSAQWWSAVQSVMGTGEVTSPPADPSFATSSADLIESLLCTTSTGGGHLGVNQIRQGTGPSRSGDLACVTETNAQNLSPGAVGLATYADRKGTAPSGALLTTCLSDLARAVTPSFATNFNVNTGNCVNLARALPALRLLSTGELGKRTSVLNGFKADPRLADLLHRLVQGWSQLHGFIASTGLAERQFEDATSSTPAAARQNLLSLLDVLDAGWSALLDQRVAPAVASIAGSEDGSDQDLFWPQFDYRLAKQPLAYWTFNGATAGTDIMHGISLAAQRLTKCSVLVCPPVPTNCLIQTSRNSFKQSWSCPGYGATVPSNGQTLGNGGNLSVVFNIDPIDAEFAPYSGGTIVATETLAVIETWSSAGPTLNIVHPTGTGTTEWVPFNVGPLGHWTSGTTGDDGTSIARGTSVAVVRDSRTQTYTVYVFNTNNVNGLQIFTRGYQSVVTGHLDGLGAGRVLIGAGPINTITGWWASGSPAPKSSYAAFIDDVAIFDSMLSKREFVRFAQTRQYVETHRDAWPANLALSDYGTQEIVTPVATGVLDALAAHLELADRLAVHMRYEAQAACDSQDPSARADIDTLIARLGRTTRQAIAIEALVASGDSDSANKDRALVGAKLSQLIRDIDTLVTCRNPYGMTATEVPLYFDSISPLTSETTAFFAASDHLLALAEQRATAAQTALDTVRTRWDQARQSEIQQLQSDTVRTTRVEELTTRYGEDLIRLCGISDRTPDEVIADVNAGTFAIDTCFIKPPGAGNSCPTSSTSGPVMDADPSCYRGVLGTSLMDTRAAYFAQQAAYQAWQAAVGNAAAQEKLCVLKEMDVFGCSALDRHALSGVTCPPGHEGTIALTEKYLQEQQKAEAEKSFWDTLVHTISTAATVVVTAAATGPGAAFLVGLSGALSPLSGEMADSMADRQRAHEAMLQERALIEDVRACWNTADQLDRAVGAAEQASQEATAKMQASIITFENGVAEAQEAVATATVEIDRELNRPSIPIAFHYWLPEALENFQFAFDTARRYTYMALRATEYDMLDSYAAPQSGKPSRAAVLGAWLPPTLTQQLSMMRDQTNTRRTAAGPPRLGHMTFDLGARFWGLTESDPAFGDALAAHAEPVYSSHGEYLGLGVRFSLVPRAADESPIWRCAERIWRVNVGATGFPSIADGVHVKLLKKNLFASRRCHADGFQVGSLRPGGNLLVAGGDPGTYTVENTSSAADVALMDFNQPDALFNFKTRDDFLNGSSSELSLQELYGDYVLLFPAATFTSGLVLSDLRDFFLRVDFLSIDNTPPVQPLRAGARIELPARPAAGPAAIVMP